MLSLINFVQPTFYCVKKNHAHSRSAATTTTGDDITNAAPRIARTITIDMAATIGGAKYSECSVANRNISIGIFFSLLPIFLTRRLAFLKRPRIVKRALCSEDAEGDDDASEEVEESWCELEKAR